MRRAGWVAGMVVGLVATAAIVAPRPANADEGDKAGWSVATDPRKRAFLKWVPVANGPRQLLFACLRDADTFAVYSTGVPGVVPIRPYSRLTLSWGDRRYSIVGTVDPEPGNPRSTTFTADTDQDATGRAAIARELLPVLTAAGPLVLQIDKAPPIALPTQGANGMAGIEAALAVFQRVCFTP